MVLWPRHWRTRAKLVRDLPKTLVFGTLETPFGQVEESASGRGRRGRVFGTQQDSLLREVHPAEEGLRKVLILLWPGAFYLHTL